MLVYRSGAGSGGGAGGVGGAGGRGVVSQSES